MNNILIIGNGFDLDLGLPTRYSDFIDSSNFKAIVSHNNMALALQKESKVNKWIDVETFIKDYVVQNQDRLSPNVTETEFEEIRESLLLYMSSISYDNIKLKSNAATLLKALSGNDDFLIYNFNYTDFDKICNALNARVKCTHIHGDVKRNNIIWGTEDAPQIPLQYNFIKKSFSSNYVRTNIKDDMKCTPRLIVYGHSLGVTDRHYFYETFKMRSGLVCNSVIRIFTFDRQSEYEIKGNIKEMVGNFDNFVGKNDFKIYYNDGKSDEQSISSFLREVYESTLSSIRIRDNNYEIIDGLQ